MRSLPFPIRRASEILPTKRQNRTRSLLCAFVASSLIVAAGAVPALALNEPQLRQTYPRHLGSVRSVDAALLRATFDRDLDQSSTFRLRDNTTAIVPGAKGFDHPSVTGGPRSITFAPAAALTEALSPYSARVRACANIPSIPCGVIDFSFFIDDTAPAAPVITDPLTGQYRTDQPVLLEGTAEPGAAILVAEDMDPTNIIAKGTASTGGFFVIPLPYGPEDGVSHTIRAYAVDEAGNVSNASADVTFVHDSVVFKPIITSPYTGQVFGTTTIPVTGLAKAGTLVDVEEGGPVIGSTIAAADRSWAMTVTALEGVHTITASADDGFVVDGPSNPVTFRVDLTAPLAPVITSPIGGSYVNRRTFRVEGTAEADSTLRLSEGATLLASVVVDGSGDWGATVTLPDGPHVLSAVAVDAAENASPAATVSFTVDTVAPVAPLITAPSEGEVLATVTFNVEGKAEVGALVTVYEGLDVIGTDTANGTGDWQVPGVFADGAHGLVATAQDAAGNVSAVSGIRHFGVDTVLPAAPQILSPVTGEISSRAQVTVSGRAEANAGVTLYDASLPVATTSALGDGTWRVNVVLTGGTHVLEADATDLAGNVGPLSPSVTFDVVLPPVDSTPPSAPTIVTPAAGSTQPGLVRIKGFAEVGSTVAVREGSIPLGTATADSVGAWDLAVHMGSGAHTIVARATDRAGNVGPDSSPRPFSVDATRPTVTIDAQALLVPGTQIAVLTPLANLTGSAADTTGVARVELEFTDKITGSPAGTAVASVCTGCPGALIDWEADQPPAGLYRVAVFAVDTVGNRSLPATLDFITLGISA